MHVLIVAYYYPPDRQVGALRPARIAQRFAAAGHDVTVLTAQAAGKDTPAASERVTVRPVRSILSPREAYLKARHRLMSTPVNPGPAPIAAPGQPSVPGDGTPLWKRAIYSLLWLPDDRQGFIPAAARAARRVHRAHPVDLIISTAPPFSAHLAGLAAKRRIGARWAADFRDPWSNNPTKPAAFRTAASDAIDARLEAWVLARADLVVSASEGIERQFRSMGVPADKLLLVRNGIDHVDRRVPPTPGSPFRILHMGTFYHGRDPRPFLEAVAQLRHATRLTASELRICFVGSSRQFDGRSIPAMTEELGIADLVEFRDFVPREEAVRLAAESDLLLLLAQNQPDQVPQKLYEYLGTRVPILAFADEHGESARLLVAVGGHYVVVDSNAAAAARSISAAMAEPRGREAGSDAALGALTFDAQSRTLITALTA